MTLITLMNPPASPGVGASCVRNHFPHHTCQACSQVCPVQAITLTANTVMLDSDLCLRCGHCLFACPVDALENLPTARRQFRNTSLVAPFTAQAASVDELLMWHIEYGIRAVEIDMDAYPGWGLAVAALNIQLNALGEPLWQLVPPVAKHVNVRRRHLLRVNEEKVRSGSVNASQRLRRARWPHVQEHRLALDPATCVLCGACERVCKEKAIELAEQEMRVISSRCTGCDNCAVVCPTKAIHSKAEAGPCQTQRLTFTRKVCTRCKQAFPTFNADDKYCPLCQRHEHGMRGR